MAFLWCTVRVKDLERSVKFYEDVVGLKVVRRLPGPHGDIVFLGAGGETLLELMGGRSKNVDEDISIGFSTGDLDALTKELHARGVKIHSGRFACAGVHFLFVQDPDGLKVQFVEQSGGQPG